MLLAISPAFPSESVVPNVEVFRTNVVSAREAFVVTSLVQAYFPGCRVTLDLDDRERILRVQDCFSTAPLPVAAIRRLVTGLGYAIEALAD